MFNEPNVFGNGVAWVGPPGEILQLVQTFLTKTTDLLVALHTGGWAAILPS